MVATGADPLGAHSAAPAPPARVPDPALVVLVGASGSGKSTWAAGCYRTAEIVSSDALRGVVGSGVHDLDASSDAFDLLERIVAARLGRGLTTVVDTLGTDAGRRAGWLRAARRAGLPAMVVLLDTPASVCRSRNAARDRPVPVRVLSSQLSSIQGVREQLATEGWDGVLDVSSGFVEVGDVVGEVVGGVVEDVVARSPATAASSPGVTSGVPVTARQDSPRRLHGVVLQLSRFPADVPTLPWLRSMATAAEQAGLCGIALMDHLIQIPQVGRAWDPIPEPWVVLGALAASTTTLELGTLVTPVTFRAAGITAKAAATLSDLSGGRAFVGIGAGWWEREHAAYGLDFPSGAERLDAVEVAVETMRALWAPGTKPYAGTRVSLPETTCYPRPIGEIPVVVGGGGRRSLRVAARLGDGCNVPADDAGVVKVRRYLAEVARSGREVERALATVLDLPVIGSDRDEVWTRVERLRGRTAAATFAARHHAGVVAEHVERYRAFATQGVTTVFVSPPDLMTPDDVAALAPLATALSLA